jgi:hypothetical protein
VGFPLGPKTHSTHTAQQVKTYKGEYKAECDQLKVKIEELLKE